MDKLVDFSQPIEGVHYDGFTTPVKLNPARNWPDDEGDYQVLGLPSDAWSYFQADGRHIGENCPWTIQNTAKPSTTSNEELTQRMVVEGSALDMLRHVLTIAADHPMVGDEAAKLLSDLPKPVDPIDPDVAVAESIADRALDITSACLEAIKAGRTLAAGGTAHE